MQVLLVEDDPATARSIELAVKSVGNVCQIATYGEDGLRHAISRTFDIIVLDMMLPDMDGMDFIRRLRAERKCTPLLVLSGIDDVEYKVEALNRGADDYLAKPFDARELTARLDAIVRRAETERDEPLRVGGLTIDIKQHTTKFEGRPLALSPKEFAILELLCRRRGEALHKDAFLNHLYGGMDEPAAKIIDVFVCKLRKKLLAVTDDSIRIDTVWGFGYVLRVGAEAGHSRRRAA